MKQRLYVLKNIKGYIYHVRWAVIGLIVLNLISIPISLISPKIFQILVDEVMYKRDSQKFWIVVVGMLGAFLIRTIIDGLSLKMNNCIHNSFVFRLRKDVFAKYRGSPFSFIEKKDVGELKMRMIDDVDALGDFVGEQVVNYLYGILLLTFTVITSIAISWRMTVLCILVLPIVFIVDTLIGNGTKQINMEIRSVNSRYYTSTHNSLQFWREIKVQNSEEVFIKRFRGFQEILATLGLKSIRFWAYKEVFNDFKSNYLTKVLVYMIGAFFVAKQEISVGTLIMFSEYFSMLFSSMESVNAKRIALKTNSPYYERVFETFSFPEESKGLVSMKKLNDCIRFDDVCFSYVNGQSVLKHVDLQINKGDYIAIVGKTGCGKTTLAKLLLGLYEKETGTIFFDDEDITNISTENMSDLIGVVMQDNYLFNMSIRENLLIANEDATEKDMIDACRMANIYDFITEQPNGFETVIGERGVKLSGGQKQRLSIAAALLRHPQIIVFDEATSALDKQSEDIINDSINKIFENLTVIVIAHKPATVLRAKKIIVMKDGRIAAQGTHDELKNNNKYYMNLVEGMSNEERKQIYS
ncbi:MAG: hypothetical protein DBY04_03595 [Clostridiales bacterium]|nr:MAG: hypothetical protein DBY04_03595 [Clostridiales bacterium]